MSEKESNDLPNMRSYFSSIQSATRTGRECSECGGALWNVDKDIVCEECSAVLGGPNNRSNTENDLRLPPKSDRLEYGNSETPRCAGGYAEYEWCNNSDSVLNFYND